MFWKKKRQPPVEIDVPLSPEADKFLAEATDEFNTKQAALNAEWGFDKSKKWGFDQETGIFKMHFADGSEFHAAGQILASYCASDSTWEWAWNNPHVEPGMAEDSKLCQTIGKQFGLGYLNIGKFPIPNEDFLSYLTAIGIKATNAVGAYRGSAGPIDVLITLKDPRLEKQS